MTNEDANVDVDGDDQASGGLATADEVFVVDLLGLSDSSEGKGAVDPYEVIHCKCGSHSSVGFMIQVLLFFHIVTNSLIYEILKI